MITSHINRYKGNRNADCNTVVLPKNLLTSQHTLMEDFENAADWSGRFTQDTTNFRTGTQSLTFTTDSGGNNSADKNSVSLDCSAMAGDGAIRFHIYIPDTTKIAGISFNLGMEPTGWTNYYKRNINVSALVNGWNVINNIPADFSATGSPSWSSTIRRIRIGVEAATSQIATPSFDSMYVGKRGIGAIVITFDDIWETAYTQGYASMKPLGIRGSGYIITDRVGTAGYCALAQLSEMYGNGWNMANHTKDHTDLTGLTQGQQQTEFTAAETALQGWGFTEATKYVAYPSGLFDNTTKAAMTAEGMRTGRSVRNQAEALMLSHPFELKSWSCGNTVTLANRQTTIGNAITRGEVAQMHFHKLVASASDGTEWAIADFQTLMSYIYTKWKEGLIYPITLDDLYKLTLGPVRVPKVR